MDFIEKARLLYNLSDESIGILMENMEEIPFAKGEVVVGEGQRDDFAYFVQKGFVRGYILRDGKTLSMLFAFEGDLATATLGAMGERLSRMTIEALEDSVLLKISRKEIERLFSESTELANWGRKLAEKTLLENEHYFAEYFWADKATQYFNMIKEYPELLKRLSLKKLASYLNMTPQSLSRIRAKHK